MYLKFEIIILILKMKYCCVSGCFSNSSQVNLYCFPKVNPRFTLQLQDLQSKRRIAWHGSIQMKKTCTLDALDNYKSWRICSKHFKSGKPSNFRQINDVDWVPSINVNNISHKLPKSSANGHFVLIQAVLKTDKQFHETEVGDIICSTVSEGESKSTSSNLCKTKDASIQTNISGEDIQKLEGELQNKKIKKQAFEKEDSSRMRKVTYYIGTHAPQTFFYSSRI